MRLGSFGQETNLRCRRQAKKRFYASMLTVLISLRKTTMKNNRQRTFFLWLRRDVDELKLISDDKNYDEMYAASSLTRRDGTKMLFEDYRTFKIHPIGWVNCLVFQIVRPCHRIAIRWGAFAYLVSVWQPQRTERLPKRELAIWNNGLSTQRVRDRVTRCPVFPGSHNSLSNNLKFMKAG